ncbi:MAG: B12-binding domain-containing radical SAM protein [Candidatus Abyssubacteria bacterium]
MKVLLISANTERINMPTFPLGLALVAAAAQATGHNVELLDLMTADDSTPVIESSIREFRPQAIGVSVRNIDDQCMQTSRFLLEPVKELISLCRRFSESPVVVGGAGYSIYPESALEYLEADMGIWGEGEVAFTELLGRLERGANLSGTPGLFLRGKGLQGERVFVHDLDTLPLPDVHMLSRPYAEAPDFWLPFQTRRGCSMDCSYCSTAAIEGRTLRKRSPEKVAEAVRRYREIGFKRFYFTDNTFNLPASYARQLCRQLTEKAPGISWRCIVYPIRLDENLAKAMADAGCAEVSLGSESGSEQMLTIMNKRFSPDDVRHTSDLLRKNGIRRMGFLLLGGPGETRETALESLSFADSLALEAVKVTVGIRIYPNTALARTAIAEGLVPPNENFLFPTFYVVPKLKDWLIKTAKNWVDERQNWFM